MTFPLSFVSVEGNGLTLYVDIQFGLIDKFKQNTYMYCLSGPQHDSTIEPSLQ